MGQSTAFQNTVIHDQDTKVSFSGADITVVIGNKSVGSIQALSYSVTREKGPWYTMRGTANPGGFARGKRACGGTLVFLTIDEQALYGHMRGENYDKAYLPNADVRYDYADDDIFSLFEDSDFTQAGAGIEEANFSERIGSSHYDRSLRPVEYADQLLPFDVHASASNEYGQAMKKTIVGIEIMNEGGGVSIDDLVIEEQYTYVARYMTPWTKITKQYKK